MLKDEFIHHIRFEKRYSAHTVGAYNRDLEQFFTYLHSVYGIEDAAAVTPALVRSWMVFLMEKSLDTKSINRKISALKSFYRFLMKQGKIDENPMQKVTSPKMSKRLPVFVEEEKMDLLLGEVEFENNFTGIRDRLILEMFYFTGMRLSELTGLRDPDIDLQQSQIKVLGKRNKERIIPFGKELKKSILNYRDVRDTEIGSFSRDGWFFMTVRGKKLYEKLVYRVVNNYLSKVSSLKKKSPHVLRHTFATHMLNHGADLNAVKELLGHASLAATQVYTHNTIERLKSIYNQAHPRA